LYIHYGKQFFFNRSMVKNFGIRVSCQIQPFDTHIWVVTDLIFKYCVYSNMYTLKIWQEHFDVHKKHNSQLTQKPHPPRYVNVSKHLFIVIVHMLLSNKMLYWHSYPYQNEASGDDDFGNNISKVFWSILILTFYILLRFTNANFSQMSL